MNEIYKSGSVSAKLSPETHNKIIEIYKELFGDQEGVPFKTFLDKIIENYGPSGDQGLTEEEIVGRYENAYKGKVTELENQLTEKDHVIFRLESENTILKENNNSIPEGAILITPEPVVQHFLAIMSAAASKKAGKEVTPSDILKNLFWRQIVDGPGDYLPLIFTKSQIKSEIEKLKETA